MTRDSVLALSATGPDAPSFRVRVLGLADQLASDGVDLRPAPLLTVEEAHTFARAGLRDRARIALNARARLREAIDESSDQTTLISREVDLTPSLTIERLAARGRRVIYDVDDAIWFSWKREAGGHPLAFLKRSASKARWLAETARAVIAGNEILAHWLRAYSKRVHVVPSVVETRTRAIRKHEDSDELVAGWIGSPSTAASLRLAADPLGRLARRLPGKRVRLLVVGGPALAVPGVTVEARAWSPKAEVLALSEIDVGLMPWTTTPGLAANAPIRPSSTWGPVFRSLRTTSA